MTTNQKTSDLTLTFKTNINCSGCVERVTSTLNASEGICHWNVNTADTNKILTVHSEGITAHEVVAAVERAGFKAEFIQP